MAANPVADGPGGFQVAQHGGQIAENRSCGFIVEGDSGYGLGEEPCVEPVRCGKEDD